MLSPEAEYIVARNQGLHDVESWLDTIEGEVGMWRDHLPALLTIRDPNNNDIAFLLELLGEVKDAVERASVTFNMVLQTTDEVVPGPGLTQPVLGEVKDAVQLATFNTVIQTTDKVVPGLELPQPVMVHRNPIERGWYWLHTLRIAWRESHPQQLAVPLLQEVTLTQVKAYIRDESLPQEHFIHMLEQHFLYFGTNCKCQMCADFRVFIFFF